MKKWICAALVAMFVLPLVITGCGSSAKGEFKIGLVTDVGRINDRSFNQSAWEGVIAAAEELGLEEGEDYKYIETQDAKDYEDNMRQLPRRATTSS